MFTVTDMTNSNEPATDETPLTRRGMVTKMIAAAAAATAASALLQDDPASAATGQMYFGAANNAGPTSTALSADIVDGVTMSVYNPNGYGLAGQSKTLYGGYGTEYGVNLTAGSVGVQAVGGQTGVFGKGDGNGVSGESEDGYGMFGYSDNFYGVYGFGPNGYGVGAEGRICDLELLGSGAPPLTRTDVHSRGQMLKDNAGDIWVCVQNGVPGSWRKVAGSASAGSLHVVDPTRVYDSRWPGNQRLTSGSRTVPVGAGRNLSTGAIEVAGLVPKGARAISFTITAAGTVGGGFLAATKVGAPSYKASCLNWAASGASVANTTLCNLDPVLDPGLIIWCEGDTHVIIDVVGYYL